MGNCVSRRPSKPQRPANRVSANNDASGLTSDIRPLYETPPRNPISLPRTNSRNGTSCQHIALAASDQLRRTVSQPDYTSVSWRKESMGTLNSPCNQIDDGRGTQMLTSEFLNGGYWPSWKHYEGIAPSSVQLHAISHINYAFADIDGDGAVFLADENLHYEADIDGANGALRAWTQRKAVKPNLKVILAIGGGGSDVAKKFANVAADRQKLFMFTQSVKHLVEDYQLDGVDIDWEHPTGSVEARHYLQLLKGLRQALGWHRWVTAALPAGQWALQKLDLAQIAKVVDFINLMAYDFVGPSFANVHRTGHHAQLFCDMSVKDGQNAASGAKAVEYLINRGVPSRKIMLGVPAYGRVFRGADAPHQPFLGPGSGNEATYEVKDLPRPGMTEEFDQSVAAATASGNGEFITYDNKDSVRVKADYVRQHNLRGLFYWHLAGDRHGDASLVQNGYEVLRNGSDTKSTDILISIATCTDAAKT